MDSYIVSQFMDRLLEDHENEVKEGNQLNVKLLKTDSRKFVWNMCAIMGLEEHGVQGQSCRLLERYLALYMRENAHIVAETANREEFKKALVARFPILLGSCIQLVVKMTSVSIPMTPKLVRSYLHFIGFTFSVQEIIASEFHVYSTLGYCVPLWSSVDAALVIAVRVNLPTELHRSIRVIVNLCEYNRDNINRRVCSVVKISPSPTTTSAMLSTLHLAAGAVIASARLLDSLDSNTTALVASVTHATTRYIKCVSDIIVSDITSRGDDKSSDSTALTMEGFLHHMAPQFLHPALQSFGCGAFRPIGGAFHPLYPGKAFARHLGEQYALGQSVGQALRSVRDESSTPPLYRHTYAPRDDTSSPGSATSASPRPCKDDEPPAAATCTDSHDFFSPDGERKSSCGVCGARLGPGVAQAHFLQELQHLYSLSALPRDVPSHSLQHQDEDARWETYQRIRANRQRRLKLRTRKRHHTVESMLGYDLEDRREDRPREPRYDAEDEPVDVEGDSLGWPESAISVDEKEQRIESDKLHLSYGEDLEISSTNDAMQSPERVRIETPKPLSLECTKTSEAPERPPEVSTSDPWGSMSAVPPPHAADAWPALAAEAYIQATRHKIEGENLPSSTNSRN